MSSSTSTLDRYSVETSTCYGKDNQNLIEGFFGQFQDSFCYTFLLQFLIVTFMYNHVGKSKYWKLLFYASLAGLLGALLENGTVAFLCRSGAEKHSYQFVFPFFINELFWISNDYAIPLINLIKMRAFNKRKVAFIIKYVIIILFVPFAIFRLCIGFLRMKNGYLQNETIQAFHGYAYAIMAIADIICIYDILYYTRLPKSKFNNIISHSNYTILIVIDTASALLSIINMISNVGPFKNSFPTTLFTPFQCLQRSSFLILATDAFIFKYENFSILGNNHDHEKSFDSSNNNFSYYNISNSSTTTSICNLANINTELSSKTNSTLINISPYNYTSLETSNSSNRESINIANSKCIIKNYLNCKSVENINIPSNVRTYSQLFGSLSQQA